MNLRIVELREFTTGSSYIVELKLSNSYLDGTKLCKETVYAYVVEDDMLEGNLEENVIYVLSKSSPYEQWEKLEYLEEKRRNMEYDADDYSKEYDLLVEEIEKEEKIFFDLLSAFQTDSEEVPEDIGNVLQGILAVNRKYKKRWNADARECIQRIKNSCK